MDRADSASRDSSQSAGEEGGPFFRVVKALAIGCNLRENFILDLLEHKGDDWSFLIKVHALLESVVCQLIATNLKRPELEELLAQEVTMESRITMLKAMGLTDENERRMMRSLGRLRNSLVHNANQTDFAFKDYFSNKQRRDNFVNEFAYGWPDPIPGLKLSRLEFAQRAPRVAVVAAVLGIAAKNVDAKLALANEQRQKLIMDTLGSAMNPPQDK